MKNIVMTMYVFVCVRVCVCVCVCVFACVYVGCVHARVCLPHITAVINPPVTLDLLCNGELFCIKEMYHLLYIIISLVLICDWI